VTVRFSWRELATSNTKNPKSSTSTPAVEEKTEDLGAAKFVEKIKRAAKEKNSAL